MLKKKLIQLNILIIIILIFIFTYQKYFKKNIENEVIMFPDKSINEATVAFNIEYLASDEEGNSYKITAEKSIIDKNDINVLNLLEVKAVFISNNENKVTILSDNAKYDKINFNTQFFNSVELFNDQNIIYSDNIDLDFNENSAIIYNNVKFQNDNSTMKADKITYDLIKKVLKINMFDKDNDIKIKSNN